MLWLCTARLEKVYDGMGRDQGTVTDSRGDKLLREDARERCARAARVLRGLPLQPVCPAVGYLAPNEATPDDFFRRHASMTETVIDLFASAAPNGREVREV